MHNINNIRQLLDFLDDSGFKIIEQELFISDYSNSRHYTLHVDEDYDYTEIRVYLNGFYIPFVFNCAGQHICNKLEINKLLNHD